MRVGACAATRDGLFVTILFVTTTASLSAWRAAVGLSYSTHHRDYNTNDTATAADSHAFLRAFFARYPHLQHNDFYIAGQCLSATALLW
jgi:hypothetical protein